MIHPINSKSGNNDAAPSYTPSANPLEVAKATQVMNATLPMFAMSEPLKAAFVTPLDNAKPIDQAAPLLPLAIELLSPSPPPAHMAQPAIDPQVLQPIAPLKVGAAALPAQTIASQVVAWHQTPDHSDHTRPIDALIDQLYSNRQISKKNIAIIAVLNGGNGDLIFGLKLAKFIQSRFPGNEITLFTQDEDLQTAYKLCGKEFESVREYIKLLPEKPEKEKFDLVIEGPVILYQWKKITSDPEKVLQLTEYGFSHFLHDEEDPLAFSDQTFSTGLGKEELGIFVEPHPPSNLLRTDELDLLQSQPLKGALLGNQKSRQYLESTSFYFGYSFYAASNFIHSVIGSADPTRNRDICLAGQSKCSDEELIAYLAAIKRALLSLDRAELEFLKKSFKSDKFVSIPLSTIEKFFNKLEQRDLPDREKVKKEFSEYIEYFLEELSSSPKIADGLFLQTIRDFSTPWSKQNIDTVLFVDKTGASYKFSLCEKRQNGRTLRIILAPSLEHMDMIRLNRAAKPLTICTGDQSLSDVISLAHEGIPKVFIYEALDHKNSFFKDQRHLAQKFGKVALFYKSVKHQDASTIARLMKEPDFLKSFEEFTLSLITHHNLATTLVPKIRRMLTRNFKEEETLVTLLHDPSSTSQKIVEGLEVLANTLQKRSD